MLRVILIFICAAAAAGPVAAQPGQSLRRAVALLDYVSGDYGRAVSPSGEVLSPDEFAEQQHFVAEAAQELRDEAPAEGADLAGRLDALRARIEAKAPPAEVAPEARAVRDEIAQRFQVALLPLRAPDVARGAQLYAQACAACHGAAGRAPAKEQLGLSTQPPSFAVPEEVRPLSPQRVFSATTYGVPNTAMPGFEEAFDDTARWDLAYFVFTLAHPPPADPQRGQKLAAAAFLPSDYRELAAQSDEALTSKLAAAGLSASDAERALASLRAGPFREARDAS